MPEYPEEISKIFKEKLNGILQDAVTTICHTFGNSQETVKQVLPTIGVPVSLTEKEAKYLFRNSDLNISGCFLMVSFIKKGDFLSSDVNSIPVLLRFIPDSLFKNKTLEQQFYENLEAKKTNEIKHRAETAVNMLDGKLSTEYCISEQHFKKMRTKLAQITDNNFKSVLYDMYIKRPYTAQQFYKQISVLYSYIDNLPNTMINKVDEIIYSAVKEVDRETALMFEYFKKHNFKTQSNAEIKQIRDEIENKRNNIIVRICQPEIHKKSVDV